MLDLHTLKKYDKSRMYKIYDGWPEIANEAYNNQSNPVNFLEINHVVFAGMGGSGALGDLFSSILSKSKIHVSVVKGYLLPRTVDSNTLVVITSVSGNSIEPLTILDSAKKLNCKIIGFSSGGKLEAYSKSNKIEYRKIPQLHSPRASFTQFLYSMLQVLEPIIPIKKETIQESISQLKILKNKIDSSNLKEENLALKLANWIEGVPLVYYPWGLQAAAIRFKNSLQENAKMHAMVEDVVESSHNGVVAWEKPSNLRPILLQGEDDYIKTKERWKILQEYFETNKIEYQNVFSVKGDILSKIVNLIYLLDYCSVYKAVLSGTDPSPTLSINYIKNRLDN